MTEHFSYNELTHSSTADRLGIDNTPSKREKEKLFNLALMLEKIRLNYGKPIYINSAYRSKKLNDAINGSKTSQHVLGEAADIRCDNNKALWDLIVRMIKNKEITVGQLIDEKNLRWIHISTGTKNQIFAIK